MPLSNTFSVPENIDVHHPLPTDGDSVYSKDIWTEESVFTNWSGDITDLFDNLHTQVSNVTTDNPKSITLHFNRTIVGNTVGLGCTGGGDFSNVVIKLKNSGGELTTVIDQSSNNTKYTTLSLQLPVTAGYNALVIEFHTIDQITLSNIVILKSISVISRSQGVDVDGIVHDFNATKQGNPKFSLDEHDESFVTKPLPVVTSNRYITKVDEATATITYIGKATPGTLGSTAFWQIQRIDTSSLSGDFLFADGEVNFDKTWDDRASLSYS